MNPKEQSGQTRMQILQAAFAAFAEKGYDGTSMDDIVKRSGLSKGTLYWHFKNKHDLLLATIDMAMNDMQATIQAIINEDISVSARLRRIFAETTEIFLEQENLLGLLANFFFQTSQSSEAQGVMRRAYAIYLDQLAALIQEGIDSDEFRPVDPRMTAIMLMGAGDGVIFQALLKPDWDVRAVLQNLLDLTLRGLQKESSGS